MIQLSAHYAVEHTSRTKWKLT